jgi:hypothetical protein
MKGETMTQASLANYYSFSDANATLQISYYPLVRLEYKGPEGHVVYPSFSPGYEMMIQEQSSLGQLVTVVLVPSVDGPSVNLTLLLPPVNMAGQQEQHFATIALKTINSVMLSTPGAQLTYEVLSLQGTAQYLLHPPYSWQEPLPDEPQEAFREIADEIIKMSEVDQQMRKSEQWDASIDVANTKRMKEIVEQMGWPTRSKVGGHASEMAWLLVQHADLDRAFQRMCLELMKAQAAGEVSQGNIAYLEDRVRVGDGRPQLYGTQFSRDETGHFGPQPIEDADHVDERRQAMGLQPLSDYARDMEQAYKQNQKN